MNVNKLPLHVSEFGQNKFNVMPVYHQRKSQHKENNGLIKSEDVIVPKERCIVLPITIKTETPKKSPEIIRSIPKLTIKSVKDKHTTSHQVTPKELTTISKPVEIPLERNLPNLPPKNNVLPTGNMVKLDQKSIHRSCYNQFFNQNDIPGNKSSPNIILTSLIMDLRRNHNVKDYKRKKIYSMDPKLYAIIFRMVYNTNPEPIDSLNGKIAWEFIKKLMRVWTGYERNLKTKDQQVITNILNKLKIYLKVNLDYIFKNQQTMLEQVKKECQTDQVTESLHVECNYRDLKTLVNHSSNQNKNATINFKTPLTPAWQHDPCLAKDIANWPNFSIRIALPNLEICRQVTSETQYKLIKLDPITNNKPKTKIRDLGIRVHKLTGKHQEFNSSFICEYINQIKSVIWNNRSLSQVKKMDMVSVLNEFQNDLNFCTKIETHKEYHMNMSQYPYVRFLGQSNTTDLQPQLNYNEQTAIRSDDSLNVRLREIIYPSMKFSLTKFEPSYNMSEQTKLPNFNLAENLLYTNNGEWIYYTCCICDKKFSGVLTMRDIKRHILTEHGPEPEWTCTKCNYISDTVKLSSNRWTHTCTHIM